MYRGMTVKRGIQTGRLFLVVSVLMVGGLFPSELKADRVDEIMAEIQQIVSWHNKKSKSFPLVITLDRKRGELKVGNAIKMAENMKQIYIQVVPMKKLDPNGVEPRTAVTDIPSVRLWTKNDRSDVYYEIQTAELTETEGEVADDSMRKFMVIEVHKYRVKKLARKFQELISAWPNG